MVSFLITALGLLALTQGVTRKLGNSQPGSCWLRAKAWHAAGSPEDHLASQTQLPAPSPGLGTSERHCPYSWTEWGSIKQGTRVTSMGRSWSPCPVDGGYTFMRCCISSVMDGCPRTSEPDHTFLGPHWRWALRPLCLVAYNLTSSYWVECSWIPAEC